MFRILHYSRKQGNKKIALPCVPTLPLLPPRSSVKILSWIFSDIVIFTDELSDHVALFVRPLPGGEGGASPQARSGRPKPAAEDRLGPQTGDCDRGAGKLRRSDKPSGRFISRTACRGATSGFGFRCGACPCPSASSRGQGQAEQNRAAPGRGLGAGALRVGDPPPRTWGGRGGKARSRPIAG